MSPSELQMERLARRISWLDRFRRRASILSAALVAALLLWFFTGWFPSNWPTAHVVCVAAMIGIIVWYGIESVLGFALALWETDYAQLTRPAKLPRAEVVVRRKSRD